MVVRAWARPRYALPPGGLRNGFPLLASFLMHGEHVPCVMCHCSDRVVKVRKGLLLPSWAFLSWTSSVKCPTPRFVSDCMIQELVGLQLDPPPADVGRAATLTGICPCVSTHSSRLHRGWPKASPPHWR